jgi:hypothetical protein
MQAARVCAIRFRSRVEDITFEHKGLKMQRFFRLSAAVVLTFAALGTWAPSAEASFARTLKRSYGGTLSTNTSTSTQQLTSDPDGIAKGSVSTEYNPAIVTLKGLLPGPVFDVSALIGIRLPTDPAGFERFVSDTAYFAGLPFPYTETGYLQVTFIRDAGTTQQSIINPEPGFVIVDTDGEINGDDTHALFFEARNPGSNDMAAYRIYQEDGTHHAVLPDYLINLDNELFTSGITEANVQGTVPEPATISLALAGGALLLARRRR